MGGFFFFLAAAFCILPCPTNGLYFAISMINKLQSLLFLFFFFNLSIFIIRIILVEIFIIYKNHIIRTMSQTNWEADKM
jgi:hypothetical protein